MPIHAWILSCTLSWTTVFGKVSGSCWNAELLEQKVGDGRSLPSRGFSGATLQTGGAANECTMSFLWFTCNVWPVYHPHLPQGLSCPLATPVFPLFAPTSFSDLHFHTPIFNCTLWVIKDRTFPLQGCTSAAEWSLIAICCTAQAGWRSISRWVQSSVLHHCVIREGCLMEQS